MLLIKRFLLISIIDLIASHRIQTNKIVFTEELENCFHQNWERYVGKSIIFKPKAGTPYWHLNSGTILATNSLRRRIRKNRQAQKEIHIHRKRSGEHIKFAVIDQVLFQLLQDNANRTKLREALIKQFGYITTLNYKIIKT